MKEVSRIYKITGFGSSAEYYTFVHPDGHEVKFPNPDIHNIKFTKHIAPGEPYDISLLDTNT